MISIGSEVIYERGEECIFAKVEAVSVSHFTVIDEDGKKFFAPKSKVFPA